MNNHFEAKGVANAAMLRHRLGLPVPGTYPESFVEHFPALRGIVRQQKTLRSRPAASSTGLDGRGR